MNAQQEQFVREYLVDLNASAAAIRAGYSKKGARQRGIALLKQPEIAEAVREELEARALRTQITADKVLIHWWKIATADPNEISQYRRGACRHCFGKAHLYQWRDHGEFADACQRADDRKKPHPKDDGGYGFNGSAEPNPKCPRCNGEGIGQTHIADTRHLKGAARLLYAGTRQTREGIEVKTRDQDKAMENVARHLGMFNDKLSVDVKATVQVNINGRDADL